MMAFIRVITLALALVTSSTWCTHPSKRNQYEAHENSPQLQLLTEATDHPPELHQNTKQSDLQVGCGDGFIRENSSKNSETDKNRNNKSKRTKRSYTAWSQQFIYTQPLQSISIWKPPIYQLSRPYFIPIYGIQGKPPIYFPPQPLFSNTGNPKDNPNKKPFKGPSYLPPAKTTTTIPTMEIGDRFNGGDNFDDRPIWDSNSPTQQPSTTMIPTRKTRPPQIPPLIHNPTDPESISKEKEVQLEYNNVVTTPSPSPSLPANPYEPSRCVWATISCCSSTNQISYDCFERLGCSGAFWDKNPCDSDFARAAITAALNYYNRK